MSQQAHALTQFGRRCRELRAEHGKLVRQQAHSFRCEPSEICAIEFGKKDIPVEWAPRVANWLQLDAKETAALCNLADIGRVFELVPKDAQRAKLLKAISENLNRLSSEQVDWIVEMARRPSQ